jgi:hypothetical protein
MSPTRLVSIVIVFLAMAGVLVIGANGGDSEGGEESAPVEEAQSVDPAPVQEAPPAPPPGPPSSSFEGAGNFAPDAAPEPFVPDNGPAPDSAAPSPQ